MPLLASFGSTSVKGLQAPSGGGGLYQFTNHTFTSAGLTGQTGPNLSQLRSAYSSVTWAQDSAFLNVTITGIQNWTVPKDGVYEIICRGARGTSGQTPGGNGGTVQGRISLTQGDILYIIVGQEGIGGGWGGGAFPGGGGASDIRQGGSALSNRILVAGGGGGGSQYTSADKGTGGVGGYPNGGSIGTVTTNSGFNISGATGGTQSSGGSGGASGGAAGEPGAGGAGGSGFGGGGGGGYYGGGGGGYYTPGVNTATPGGGGSGFINTSLFTNTGANNGNISTGGSVTITLIV